MINLVEPTEHTFGAEVGRANLPVVVDFYAPWRGPCKMIGPLIEQLAGEYAGRVNFAKTNVDETPDLAAQFRIEGVPTLRLFRNGRAADQIVGFNLLQSSFTNFCPLEIVLKEMGVGGCCCKAGKTGSACREK